MPTSVGVVIDVFRAFTTSAIAFEQGAERIICVRDLDAARSLRQRLPHSLLVGEDNGLQPDEFDFGNSPTALLDHDLTGRTLVLRTSNGTKGLAQTHTDHLLAAGGTNTEATADFIKTIWPSAEVFFVPTRPGREDQACADHIALRLAGQDVTDSLQETFAELAKENVAKWEAALGPNHPDVLGYAADVAICCEVDRSNVAMVGTRTNEGIELRAHLLD